MSERGEIIENHHYIDNEDNDDSSVMIKGVAVTEMTIITTMIITKQALGYDDDALLMVIIEAKWSQTGWRWRSRWRSRSRS